MKIPKEIQIIGQTIKTKLKKDLGKDYEDSFGTWDQNTSTVDLRKSTKKDPIAKEVMEQTYIHELTHASLELMGEPKLSLNEKFVTSLSQIIYQIIKQVE